MKFTVHYIDDPAHPQTVDANTAEMAALRFVQQQPRSDESQITVEEINPCVPWRSVGITHCRACDVAHKPAPPDEPEPDLAVRYDTGREVSYVVCGSSDSLRQLANGLLRALDQHS